MCQVGCTPGGLLASSCAPLTNCIFLPPVSQIHCTNFFHLSLVLSTPLIWCFFYLLCLNKEGTANDEYWAWAEDMTFFSKHLLLYVFPVTLSGYWLMVLRLKLQTGSLFSYCNNPPSIKKSFSFPKLEPKSPAWPRGGEAFSPLHKQKLRVRLCLVTASWSCGKRLVVLRINTIFCLSAALPNP